MGTMTTYKFSFPTLIHFGAGVRHQAGEHLMARGYKRPLLVTDKGRSVRADYRVEASKGGERRRWAQELTGTPFEKLFREVVYEVALAPADAGTDVGIEVHQKPVGWARFGGLMLRRAARRQLDEALERLAGLLEAEA